MDLLISISQYARRDEVVIGLDLLAAYLRTMNMRGTSRTAFVQQLGLLAYDDVYCQDMARVLKPLLHDYVTYYAPEHQPRLHFELDCDEETTARVKQGLDALAHALKTRSGRGISRSALIEQLGMAARREPHAGQIARVLAPIFGIDFDAPIFV